MTVIPVSGAVLAWARDFRGLALALRERANAKMENLQREIASLRGQLDGFRLRDEEAEKQLTGLVKAAERAIDSFRNGESGYSDR